MKVVNWGIIGAGNVTELKSGPAFNKVCGSRIAAVMRRNAGRAEDYANRHKIPKWYTHADDLINDPEVNAIYIATPPHMHAEYAIRSMQAGKPVYVEKPMALNYSECKKMLKVSEETGVRLFVAYYRRTLPAFLKVKELVDTGQIGMPLSVNVQLIREAKERNMKPGEMSWHVYPEISGGGYFFDLASHQFDFLDFLFGPVSQVKGIAVNQAGLYPAEDTVNGSFSFENGITGSGTWCFAAHKSAFTDSIEIIGDGGKISLSTFLHGEVIMHNREGIHKFRYNNPENIQLFLIEQVVGAILNNSKCVSTGETAARTSAVLDEMVKDYYGHTLRTRDRHKGSCRADL